MQILFDFKLLQSIKTNAVIGSFEPDNALTLLLRGTGLTFNRVNESTLAIHPAGRETSGRPVGELAGAPAQDRNANVPVSPSRSRDRAAANGALPEMVVTATRRAENQLDVPMTMTVIGAAQLKAQEVTTFVDLASMAPNLSFNYGAPNGFFGGNTDDRATAIRGIQGSDTTGFYIDELPIPASLNPRLPDLERIEVLKGPQGTLYGARSMGGTVRMITRAPSLDGYSGNAFAQANSIDGGGSGYALSGTVNVPLITDTLALRLTPYRGEDAGYINRVWPRATSPGVQSIQRNSAQSSYSGITASLLWTPADFLKIRPMYLHQETKTNGLPMGDYSASNLTNVRNFDIPEGITEKFQIVGMTLDFSLRAGTITSATSYLDRRTLDREDLSEFTAFAFGTPLLAAPVAQFSSNRNFSEELRFTSGWPSSLRLTGGVFYSRKSSTVDFVEWVGELMPLVGTAIAAANHGEVVESDRAVFGELTYEINSQWSATVGSRYSKSQTLFTLYAWGAAFGAASKEEAVPAINPESDGVFTPKFLIKYQPNDTLNIYADAAKGFRPGSGQVTPAIDLCASEYARIGLTPAQLSSFKSDSVWSYELGAKMRSGDRRYALDAALFWIQWTEKRQLLPLACGFSSTINSGSAMSRGVELDFSAAPTDRLTLMGGIGYDDATILDPGSLLEYPAPGSPVQQVAPFTGKFNARYELPVGSDARMSLQMNYSYTANSYSATTSAQAPLRRPAYSLVNLRAALKHGSTEVALFVKNVGDAHPNLGEGYSIGGFVPGRLRWNTGVPRMYGMELSLQF